MVGPWSDPDRNSQNEGSLITGKRYHEVGFAYTASHKRAVLSSFELEFTESLLDIFSYPNCTIGPTMVGLKEKFSK